MSPKAFAKLRNIATFLSAIYLIILILDSLIPEVAWLDNMMRYGALILFPMWAIIVIVGFVVRKPQQEDPRILDDL